MNGSRRLPFGPDQKDQLWRTGAWFAGVVVILVLIWTFSGGAFYLLGIRTWFLILVLASLLSLNYGLKWRRGQAVDHSKEERAPHVEVVGKDQSTYVLFPQSRSRRVRPRELEPIPWALYSTVIRAPVFAGDVVLTLLWWLWDYIPGVTGGPRIQDVNLDQIDHADRHPNPSRRRF